MVVQKWMQSNQKMLKLVLRFISTALRAEGVFEACQELHSISRGKTCISEPMPNMDVVCEVVDILCTLAAHSW
jgi:hypothetical protein